MAISKDQQVENALFRKCIGYEEVTKKPIKLKKVIYSETGRKLSEEEYIEYATETKFVEPNVSAIAMYLKNRMPAKWGNLLEAEFTQIALQVLDE